MESPFRLIDIDRSAPPPPVHDQVFVGVADRPRDVTGDFDVLLTAEPDARRPWVSCADPHAAARHIRDTVARQPAASVALVQVLRMGRALPPSDRLLVESLAYSALQGGAGFRDWLAVARPGTPRPTVEPVRLRRDGDRLTVVLERPWVRNAFDAATRDALCEALEVAVADPSITRVDLCGAGPAFCSGGDLTEFGSSRDTAEAHLVRVRRSPAGLLLRCGRKVTARLHGACVGAGIELAAFAGRVAATPDTAIRLPEIGMGLIPGAGGTVSLPARIGRERTAYLALSGGVLTAAEALRWGLVDEITQTPPEPAPRTPTAMGVTERRSRI
ncbi:enoyl-CoA hydratase/isomerase family protein [Streptomyces sp. Li-HN-5-11]|uniref:enoyl-CoA hydratase/isomerase family protein n=1 Tax=Streptomyces sp. Li-HN-5-11 TaxID=3075432 RepID=UPI0028B1DBB6|nr:enoyl-CoA hydratase/isomerase family protein [Streptomyces sp. Li-HN-5-11]WNM31735.1 enoyl-CoA hydratase/isomerase family protein [Streptomyces sp. Li-HN-5-11]